MLRKILFALSALIFAFAILILSVFRTAAVKYEVSGETVNEQDIDSIEKEFVIDYTLPYPGKVLPDSPFWPLKALRDKVWLYITTNPTRKAELKLLFADKRLGSAKTLFEKGKSQEAITTLTKAEKYLEEAIIQEKENRDKGIDTSEFLIRISKASLKHYQLMEEIKKSASEEVQPAIISAQNYPKLVFEQARNALLEKGNKPQENPFGW